MAFQRGNRVYTGKEPWKRQRAWGRVGSSMELQQKVPGRKGQKEWVKR